MTAKRYDYVEAVLEGAYKYGRTSPEKEVRRVLRKLVRDAIEEHNGQTDYEHGRYVPTKVRANRVTRKLIP